MFPALCFPHRWFRIYLDIPGIVSMLNGEADTSNYGLRPGVFIICENSGLMNMRPSSESRRLPDASLLYLEVLMGFFDFPQGIFDPPHIRK
jgi:hypothetical protein